VNRFSLVLCLISLIAGVSRAGLAGPAVSAPSPTLAVREPTTVCASHILVRYWGSLGASDLRTSPVARAIAEKILARVREPGADFEAIGHESEKAYPDILYERTGPFGHGKMEKPFEETVFALQPGQIADHLIVTIHGFHIIRRNPTIHCREILIAYQGASRALVTRTEVEARKLAETVRAEALKPGADFAALARRYSDAPDAANGGDVGVFDRRMMIQSFEDAAFALKVGELSPVVETRFGFHIIQRIE